ncbi:MAG: PhzF family phenazine biosynthesis protein [Alicyclobacillus herbarius]|uniref:PhzF family phenazine biosynthesis protein n=1 Tax=Alicyclobacillus herbarius TaxID=122960 RepID=UPI0023531FED|nr:PhzF family phenazine biosynthesis protein [Alicyclobacillus herbarius]MCL6631927.1 PhzF family phenazine biosynthesis protein [Alicyclobacillus herbarius]
MRKIAVQQVDAFTQQPFSGNPAGVVSQAENLSDEEMQWIARELNCSETAFVLPSKAADLKIRYFTPQTEVNLCGHATVAALSVLHQEGRVVGPVRVETRAGILAMEVDMEGVAWMEQAAPQFQAFPQGAVPALMSGLSLSRTDLHTDIPVGLAFTGLWHILVPVVDRKTLENAIPNGVELARLCQSLGATTIHLFCFDPILAGSHVHTRDFAPAVGVLEDPHTGTANGALGAYLGHLGLLRPGVYSFEQGWTVQRPGIIQVHIADASPRVRVGGHAVPVFEGVMYLDNPESEFDLR